MKHIKIVIFLISLSVSSLSFGSENRFAKRLRISNDKEAEQQRKICLANADNVLFNWLSKSGIYDVVRRRILETLLKKTFQVRLTGPNSGELIFRRNPENTTFSMLKNFIFQKLRKEFPDLVVHRLFRNSDYTGEFTNNSQTLTAAGIRSGDKLTYVPCSYKKLLKVMLGLPEKAGLSEITNISLSFKRLEFPIPTMLGNLVKLEELNFSYNKLTDSIPTELGHLMKLRYFDLSINQLTGKIPTELGQLVNLERLFLGTNQLTGAIPSELGQLVELEVLSLSFNHLTGTIPTELGKLVNLRNFSFSYNQLTGVDKSIALMKEKVPGCFLSLKFQRLP